MTPYEIVRERYAFPFELRPYQADAVNAQADFPRDGLYWQVGAGKTSAGTVHALYWGLQHNTKRWVVLMPPILLLQWERWIKGITDLTTGTHPSVVVYHGTPAKRQVLDLRVSFILTTYGMLKNDYEHLQAFLKREPYGVIADEAEAIKNIRSDTHKAVDGIAEDRPLTLMTGTPITKPGDAYAYLKLVAPGIYRNKRHFDRLHVEEVDEWGNVEKWTNLDLLHENMKVHTSRVLRREVRKDLPPVIYTRVPYNLPSAHMNLYKRIAEERLVEFEDGSEIDAISASALRSALQQVIINWGEFDEGTDRVPAALELVEDYLMELGDAKLAVVANFRRSNAYLLEALKKYNAVAVYGDISGPNKQRAIHRFITDPTCRVILLQPASAGRGVDGLQHVCSDMLVLEAPTTAPPFEQVVGRLDRDGQEDVVNCRIAVAQGTVQVRMFAQLLDNDQVANRVQGGFKDLKDSIYGG